MQDSESFSSVHQKKNRTLADCMGCVNNKGMI